MNNNARLTVVVVVIALMLSIYLWHILAITAPPINKMQRYIIAGKVLPFSNAVGNPPNGVSIYYPNYGSADLCRGSIIKYTEIKWTDNIGNFQTEIEVPIGLKEINLITDCSSCKAATVNLENLPQTIDLIWGNHSCNTWTSSNETEKVTESTRYFLDNLDETLSRKTFNETEKQHIKKYIITSRSEISQATSLPADYNESLRHAYLAQWHAVKSNYEISMLDLKYCVAEIELLLNSHENDPCYVPDYLAYQNYNSSKNAYDSYSQEDRYPQDRIYALVNPEDVVRNVQYLDNGHDYISDAVHDCGNALGVINKTFEFQKPYCEARTISWISYIPWIMVLIYLGIIFERKDKISELMQKLWK